MLVPALVAASSVLLEADLRFVDVVDNPCLGSRAYSRRRVGLGCLGAHWLCGLIHYNTVTFRL